MTVIDERKLNEDVSIKLYEAPHYLGNRFEKSDWIYHEEPFFHSEIFKFWNLYSNPFSDEDFVILDKEVEYDERRRFIKNPIIVGKSLDSKIFGGIWVENLGEKRGQLHIKCLRGNHRQYAHQMLDFFMEHFYKKFDEVSVAWGPRNPKDDPTNFLNRNGFKILNSSNYGGRALYRF